MQGLGPAASNVCMREKGVSIGSYGGEVRFRSKLQADEDDIFDALRFVAYVGSRFNDRWVVDSELEFEHAGTGGGGSVSVELLTLDVSLLVAGLVLLAAPAGAGCSPTTTS